MTNKPLIGICPLLDKEHDMYRITRGYMDCVLQAGGLPMMLPLTGKPEDLARFANLLDGFLFPGGPDVNPALYGERRIPQCQEGVPERDAIEFPFFRLVLETTKKPILGICRGSQVICVALGGKLYQDLPTQRPSEVNHDQAGKARHEDTTHVDRVLPGTPLETAIGKDKIYVNTYHHQGFKELPEGTVVMAEAMDGLPEAFCLPGDRFLWGIQWHPEWLAGWNPDNQAIFKAFVQAAKR